MTTDCYRAMVKSSPVFLRQKRKLDGSLADVSIMVAFRGSQLDPSALELFLQNLSGSINSGLHSLHANAEKLRALLLRTALDGE